jgi:hypothetical protein
MTSAPGPAGQILLYRSEDGRTKLDVRLENDTVWLSQRQLTELFGKAKGTISEHIKHIFEDGELIEDSVVRLFRTTASDGKVYALRIALEGSKERPGGKRAQLVERSDVVEAHVPLWCIAPPVSLLLQVKP